MPSMPGTPLGRWAEMSSLVQLLRLGAGGAWVKGARSNWAHRRGAGAARMAVPAGRLEPNEQAGEFSSSNSKIPLFHRSANDSAARCARALKLKQAAWKSSRVGVRRSCKRRLTHLEAPLRVWMRSGVLSILRPACCDAEGHRHVEEGCALCHGLDAPANTCRSTVPSLASQSFKAVHCLILQ